MRIPLSLLQSFLDGLDNFSLEQMADALTHLGIEVEEILDAAPPFSGVISAEILSSAPHPDKKSLSVLKLTDGKQQYTVVTSAKDLQAEMKLAFAKEGAILRGKKVEAQTVNHVFSQGMLASEADVGLSLDQNAPVLLDPECELNCDLTSLLWDPVFDLSFTPNLGHCLSAQGIARELKAALDLSFKTPHFPLQTKEAPLDLQIELDAKSTPRYMCQLIENVNIAPSPFWLQKILKLSGLQPICNVVDITNYLLLKRGQPLHAFDRDKITGSQIFIRKTTKETPFFGLDEKERTLPLESLLISDAKGPLALAGILGAHNSSVTDTTKNILLEAAFFDPLTVRKTAKALSLKTESSHRFEKGVDPNQTKEVLEEATYWILKLAGGEIKTKPFDSHPTPFAPKQVPFRLEKSAQTLGVHLSSQEIESFLNKLSFPFSKKEESFVVEVPFFRFDLQAEIDLIEEMAKLYGYNAIERKKTSFSSSKTGHHPFYLFEERLKTKLISFGMQELLTSDLIGPKLCDALISPEMTPLKVLHAKTEEYSILRTSLLPSFLQVIQRNLDRKNSTLFGFEISKIHFLQKRKPREVPVLSCVLTGSHKPKHWSEKVKPFDFYDLKGLIETLFSSLYYPPLDFQPSDLLSFHPNRQAHLLWQDVSIGSMGEVHPALLEKFSIDQRVYFCEIDLEPLAAHTIEPKKMEELPLFPGSERDWTFSLEKGELFAPVLQRAKQIASPLLEKIEMIDLYEKEEGVKNITLRFTYRDLCKTLSFEEIEKEHQQILSKLLAK